MRSLGWGLELEQCFSKDEEDVPSQTFTLGALSGVLIFKKSSFQFLSASVELSGSDVGFLSACPQGADVT